ncbi:MAG: hypothetical protein O2890_01145 [Cyanobacteria bacterium]|nr:hypothetical protein [Cyanobacteriota bacterium]
MEPCSAADDPALCYTVYLLKCDVEFAEMYDEAVFFEDMQGLGWYQHLPDPYRVLICIRNPLPPGAIAQVLALLNQQQVNGVVEAIGTGGLFPSEHGSNLKLQAGHWQCESVPAPKGGYHMVFTKITAFE